MFDHFVFIFVCRLFHSHSHNRYIRIVGMSETSFTAFQSIISLFRIFCVVLVCFAVTCCHVLTISCLKFLLAKVCLLKLFLTSCCRFLLFSLCRSCAKSIFNVWYLSDQQFSLDHLMHYPDIRLLL